MHIYHNIYLTINKVYVCVCVCVYVYVYVLLSLD